MAGLEFLKVPLRQGEPHLVRETLISFSLPFLAVLPPKSSKRFFPSQVVSTGSGMYGFTDTIHKTGHVLFTSLLLVRPLKSLWIIPSAAVSR